MADTMGTQEASEKWGYPQSTISGWCRKGLIKDAGQDKKRKPVAYPKRCGMPQTYQKERERKK